MKMAKKNHIQGTINHYSEKRSKTRRYLKNRVKGYGGAELRDGEDAVAERAPWAANARRRRERRCRQPSENVQHEIVPQIFNWSHNFSAPAPRSLLRLQHFLRRPIGLFFAHSSKFSAVGNFWKNGFFQFQFQPRAVKLLRAHYKCRICG